VIYLEMTVQVVPGKVNELLEVFSKEFLPACEKLGAKLVGQWQTTIGNANEITDLWVYDDLTHLQRFREARQHSEEIKKALDKMWPLFRYESSRLLAPTPLSAMK
jgi:hypothetical protein